MQTSSSFFFTTFLIIITLDLIDPNFYMQFLNSGQFIVNLVTFAIILIGISLLLLFNSVSILGSGVSINTSTTWYILGVITILYLLLSFTFTIPIINYKIQIGFGMLTTPLYDFGININNIYLTIVIGVIGMVNVVSGLAIIVGGARGS